MAQAVFIADLHLKPQDARTLGNAARFFKSLIGKTDQLYILGDLVEYWIGDDAYDGSLDRALSPLPELQANGCQTFLMHGNRDFLLGEQFAEAKGITLIREDQHTIDLDGSRLLLMHGDTLCTDDIDYQAMRRQLRSPHWQQDFLDKTIEERLVKAQQLREQSQAENGRKAAEICDVSQVTVEQAMQTAGVTLLLHGHTHRPAHHQFTLPSVSGQQNCEANRWVLGDWQADTIVYAVSNNNDEAVDTLPLRLIEWSETD